MQIDPRFAAAVAAAASSCFLTVTTSGCAECTSLYDCPGTMSCSAEGACVQGDLGPVVATQAWNAPPPDSSLAMLDVREARMTGQVGSQLVVDNDARTIVVDEWGLSAEAPGAGADALFIIYVIDPVAWEEMLHTTGVYEVDALSETLPVVGQTCTTNVAPPIDAFDEPSSYLKIVVTADERSDEVTVEVTQLSPSGSDVQLVMTGALVGDG